MVVINTKNLKVGDMNSFMSHVSDEDTLIVEFEGHDMNVSTSAKSAKLIFSDENVKDFATSGPANMSIGNSKARLEFSTKDYMWYFNRDARIAKLFNESLTKKPKAKSSKEELTLNVAGAVRNDDGSFDNITRFSGKKSELIAFINRYQAEQLLRSTFTATVVFNLVADTDDMLNDVDNWFTLKELSDAEIIVLN